MKILLFNKYTQSQNAKTHRLTITKDVKNDIYQTERLTVMDHFIVQICHVMICQQVVLNLLQFVICKVMQQS